MNGVKAAAQASSVPNVRSCGCARRFVSAVPQPSQSAPVLARQRSRSSTGSSTPSYASSSGRTTPSPLPSRLARAVSEGAITDRQPPPTKKTVQPKYRYTSKCELKKTALPVRYSTTVFIRLGSNKKQYLEQVKYEMQYIPHYILDSQKEESKLLQRFKSKLEINLQKPTFSTST